MRCPAALLLLAFPLTQSVSASPASAPTYSLRWLSNALISRIWPLPNSQCAPHRHGDSSSAHSGAARHGQGGRGAPALYNQDIVLRFNLSTVEEARAIAEAAEDFSLDIWAYSENWVDLRLAKDFLPSLLTILPQSLSTAHAPLIPESTFRSLVSATDSPSSGSDYSSIRHNSLPSSSKDLFFTDYQPLNTIQPWLRLLASMFDTHARLITLGTSYEGREIMGLRVGRPPPPVEDPSDPNQPTPPHRRPRRTILITGGAHAREWISVAAVNYVAHQLVTTYGKGKDSIATRLVDQFDWIFIPTLNPDGYEHSWSSDRLWRKNRQPTSLRFCSGIDLDRGFGYRFDEDAAGRMSPCSEAWSGGHAWEALEARRVREWVGNLTSDIGGGSDELVAYLDLHSYSQQILYPYSYTCDDSPPTLENLEEMAMGLARAMGRAGGKGYGYSVAAACEGNVLVKGDGANKKTVKFPSLETGGGSPLDWFYHEVGVKYAFQIKLRDTGSYGFLLPKEEIVPQGKEVFAAVAQLGRFLLGEIGFNADEQEELLGKDKLPKESTKVVVDEDDAVRESLAKEQVENDEEWDEEDRLLSRLEFRRRRLR